MIRDAPLLLLLNALFLSAGLGVTGAAGWWRGRGLLDAVGLSYVCGVASYGVCAQVLYVIGASVARWQVIGLCAVLSLGALRGARHDPNRQLRTNWPIVSAAVTVMVLALAIDLWYQPLWAYDAWTFWTPKAHALWALGLDGTWFTQAGLTSPDYPLLLPAVEAAGFHFTGYETGLLDLQSLLLAVGFVRLIYELAAVNANRIVLWTSIAMFVVSPSLADQLAAAEADVPVAVFFAAAGLTGAIWLRDRSSAALIVTSVLAAGACATKVEGLVFAIALWIALFFVSRRAATLAGGVLSIIAGVAPWRIWLDIHHVHNQGSFARLGIGYLVDHAQRAPIAIAYMAVKMLDPRAWILLVPLFVFVVAVRRGSQLCAYATLTASLAFGGLVIAYWSTRLGFHYQLTTSARRVVTGIVFFAAAVTPVIAETP